MRDLSVFTAVLIEILVSWNVTPCRLVNNCRNLGGA